jgi:hypothetical protein
LVSIKNIATFNLKVIFDQYLFRFIIKTSLLNQNKDPCFY